MAAMRVRDFLYLALEELEPALPLDLRNFQWSVRFSFLQVHYWYPAVHYELWPQKRTGRIEFGLHFEGEREHNLRWLQLLAESMIEVQAALGREVEIEEWTPVWTRLHYTLPYGDDLTEADAAEYARRFAGFIAALQPLLTQLREDFAVPESPLTRSPRMRAPARRGLPSSRWLSA
ncbi:MAG TPA: hypothetical protein VFB90_01475 [Dehalococcoidia bacterium]|nr:hypothetical protein [Dehalococcoidia bacterium]